MPEFTPILTGGDALNITAQVIVNEPLGIRKLVYRDSFGMELGSEEFNCEPMVVGNIGTIPIRRLPFYVVVTDCTYNNEITSLPLFAYPTTTMPNPEVPLPCNPLFCPPNAPCDAAQARVTSARRQVSLLCGDFLLLRKRRDDSRFWMIWLWAVATVFAILGAIFVASGNYISVIIGVVCLVIAAIALGAAIVATINFNEANGAFLDIERRMNAALQDFNEAANDATRSCCPHCITVSLTPPTCG